MSEARKCDNCNKLFEPVHGCVSIDISVKDQKDTYHTWTDVDFCPACSTNLLDQIGHALQGLQRPRAKKERRR